KFDGRVGVFCLIEDESLRPAALALVQQLRDAGIAVEYSLTPAKSDKQFKRALELNAAFTAKPERDQAGAAMVRVKNLKDRSEQVLSSEQAVQVLKQTLGPT